MSETISAVAIPEQVLAFAIEHEVAQYLEPVLESASRNFPASRPQVILEEDAEVANLWQLVILVRSSQNDVETILRTRSAYYQEFHDLVPGPSRCLFRLGVELIDDSTGRLPSTCRGSCSSKQ